MISTARADYRSDLASSLVFDFHDILTNIRIKRLLKNNSSSLFLFCKALFSCFSSIVVIIKFVKDCFDFTKESVLSMGRLDNKVAIITGGS